MKETNKLANIQLSPSTTDDVILDVIQEKYCKGKEKN